MCSDPKPRRVLILETAFVLLVLALAVYTLGNEKFRLEDEVLQEAEKQYGPGARQRLLAWEKLIREDSSGTDLEKLRKANDFLNRFTFVSDYWATPVEFIASNGGDCEDFSLAKYFTLKAMGVPEKKLNLTYVRALNLDQPHMVLTYFTRPGAEPLVLDNLLGEIRAASERPDLLPVYSFNGAGLWIAKQRGRGQMVGRSDRLGRWRDLLSRMPQGLN
jgi:hypothetical protein